MRNHKGTIVATLAALFLASGWASREYIHAEDKAQLLKAKVLTAADMKLKTAEWEGKPTGQIAVYYEGATAGTRNFASGKFVLNPGAEPHPIHTHPEEEILIVASGEGELSCDGKTTKVGAGSIMYTTPNAPHGIKNTGKEPLTFYWVKWTGVGPRDTK